MGIIYKWQPKEVRRIIFNKGKEGMATFLMVDRLNEQRDVKIFFNGVDGEKLKVMTTLINEKKNEWVESEKEVIKKRNEQILGGRMKKRD